MVDKEGREAKRKAVKSHVECSDPDGNIVHGVGSLRDVSDTGCRIETSLKLPLKEDIRLSLFSSDNKASMDIVATVIWQKAEGGRKTYGLRFSNLTSTDLATLLELFQPE